jgi:Ribbon-helix-helix protein, copG family
MVKSDRNSTTPKIPWQGGSKGIVANGITTNGNGSGNGPKKIKVSVNLLDSDVVILKEIAKARGVTMTDALRRAIATERILDEADREGSVILIESQDKVTQRLVLR